MPGYTPHTDEERTEMLSAIGKKSMDELFEDIPGDRQAGAMPEIPAHMSEPEVIGLLENLAEKSQSASHRPIFLGAGAYNHFIPSAVGLLTSRSEFATSYTPYQPEVAQGNLQSIYEYQSMICALTDLPVSNASLYDGATALAEAVAISVRATGKRRILLSRAVSPFSRQVLETYGNGAQWQIEEIPLDPSTGQTDIFVLQEKLKGGA